MNNLREQIIGSIKNELINNPDVFAFWLEGADATGMVDEHSDIDIWLDVQDGQEEIIFEEILRIFSKFGPIDFEYEQESSNPQIRHKVFHIKGTPLTLLLDVCIQQHSREFAFTRDLPGEEFKVIFDKANVIKVKELSQKEWRDQLEKRIYHLQNTFAQDAKVKKLIDRKQFIDAFHFYYKYILLPLTELLRIKYEPKKQVFLKYISKDLPSKDLSTLEGLYKVNSLEEMNNKLQVAKILFKETLSDINMNQ